MALIFLMLFACRNDAENSELNISKAEANRAMIDTLSTELEILKTRNDSLQQAFQTRQYANDYSIFFGKQWEEIEDPEAHVKEALQKQEDLIPLKPVLGGTMAFRQVQIISEDWVLAIYDDGHVQGKSIFAYELQEDGNVEFTQVASKLPK